MKRKKSCCCIVFAAKEEMEKYRNLDGNSGVVSYAIGRNSIVVQFVDGTLYTYTFASAGRQAVEAMKKLALAGRGLSTYISRYVKDKYARKKAKEF